MAETKPTWGDTEAVVEKPSWDDTAPLDAKELPFKADNRLYGMGGEKAFKEGQSIAAPQDAYKVTATDRQSSMEGSGELKPRSWVDPVAEILVSPYSALLGGVKSGTESMKEGSESFGSPLPYENLKGSLQMVEGIAKTGFGVANVIPAMAAFTAGLTATEKVVPEKYVSYIMAPVTSLVQANAPEAVANDPAVQAAGGLLDIVSQALLLKGLHKGATKIKEGVTNVDALADKLRNGEDMTVDEVNQAAEMVRNISPEDLRDAAKDIAVEAEAPDVQPLKREQIDLEQDFNNIAKTAGEDVANELRPAIEAKTMQVAEQQANVTALEKVTAAEATATTGTAKEILAKKKQALVDAINKNKPQELKLQEDATKKIIEPEGVQVESKGGVEGGQVEGAKSGDSILRPEEVKEEVSLPEGFRFVEEGETLPAGDYSTRMDLTTERTITNAPKKEIKSPTPEATSKEGEIKTTDDGEIQEKAQGQEKDGLLKPEIPFDESKPAASEAAAAGKEAEYNSKSVEELIELKKEKYPNPDIESPMSADEKLLDRVIAKKFSEKNDVVRKKREDALQIAADHGYEHMSKFLNSIEKNTGERFMTVQDAIKSDNPKVKEFLSERKEKNTNLAVNETGKPTTKGKGAAKTDGKPKEGEAKTLRRGTPKSRRKIKDPRYVKALQLDPTSPYDVALQHFVGGGEIAYGALHELFGGAGKKIGGELKAKFGILGKNAPSIKQLAHDLWENRPQGDERFDTQDYRNAIEQVLLDHNGRKSMVDELLKKNNEEVLSDYSEDSDFRQRAEEIYEGLSEEEFNKIHDETLTDEYFDKIAEDQIGKEVSKTEISRKRLDQAKTKLSNKLRGGMQSGGLNALPEFVEYVKSFIEHYGNKAGDFVKEMKDLLPDHSEKEIRDAFEAVANKEEKPFKPEQGKKALLNRVYEGSTPEELKASIEKHGLTYEVESNAKAEKSAKDFIDEVGIDNALRAVKSGQVEGGSQTYVWGAALDKVNREMLLESDPIKKAELILKESELADDFSKWSRSQGRSISALNTMYQTSDLGYKLGTILNRAKEVAKDGVVPEEIKAELVNLSEQLNEANRKIAEFEKNRVDDVEAKIAEEVDKAINRIHDKLPTARRQKADKAIAALENIQKRLRSKTYDATIGIPVAFVDAGITVIKQAIKAGVSIADAVELGIDHIKSKHGKWDKEDAFRKDILGEFKNEDIDVKNESSSKSQLERYKDSLRKSKLEYERRLREGDFTRRKKSEKPDLDEEAFNLLVERNKIKDEIDLEIEKLKLENRSTSQKISEGFVDVVNLPKSLMASADLSAPLRQGAVLSARHPIMASRAAKEMIKQAFSEEAHTNWLARLKTTPEYETMNRSGLYLAEPKAKLSAKEEQFISNIAHKIPVWGRIVKGSERAYTGYLNKLRTDVFSQFHDALIKDGFEGEALNKELKSFADFINNASGRGGLGKFEEATPLLNSLFFSPRYAISRFNLLNPIKYAKMSPKARAEALKTVGTYIGMGAAVLAIAKAGGASVVDDPRSADFGKIRTGNTRFDIWSGLQQWVRLISQVSSGQKTTLDGKVKELGKGYKADTRLDLLERFARGKASPSAALAMDLLEGKDVAGKPVTFKFDDLKSFADSKEGQLIIPLWINDLRKVAEDEQSSAAEVGAAGLSSFFGVGVQNYDKKKAAAVNKTEK